MGPPQAMTNTRCIIVLARAPVAGQCKTRLIPARGARGAALLHQRLVRRSVRSAVGTAAGVELHGTPQAGHGCFLALRRDHPLQLRRQPHGELGPRMLKALNRALHRGTAAAVVIGTDCAALTTGDLLAAFEALEGGADAVLQPAEDGGYVLLGLRRPLAPHALNGVLWSSGCELGQTLARLRRAAFPRVHLLPTLWDLDRPADLRRAKRAGLL